MWTPLLLLCYVDRLDCAIPNAPTYPTEQACRESLQYVIDTYRLPEGMVIAGATCYNWGAGL